MFYVSKKSVICVSRTGSVLLGIVRRGTATWRYHNVVSGLPTNRNVYVAHYLYVLPVDGGQ